MLETSTRLQCARPAIRRANSNEASFSLWTPTPLVKKHFLGTIFVGIYHNKKNVTTKLGRILFDDGEHGARLDSIAGLHPHLLHLAVDRAAPLFFHLPRPDDAEPLPLPPLVAPRDEHRDDLSRHRHRDVLPALELDARL